MKLATDREIRSWTKTTAVGGVQGLILRVNESGGKSFALRMTVAGVRKLIHVCSYDQGVAYARRKAMELRIELEENPFYEDAIRNAKRDLDKQRKSLQYTVENLILEYIESEEKRGRWTTTGRQPHSVKFRALLYNHFSEKLRRYPVVKLTPEVLSKEFGEKWKSMRNTPDKCIGEIKRAWSWGIAMKKIPSNLANPADTSVLKHLLVAPSKRPKKTHYPFLPPEQIPEFVEEMMKESGCSPLCLIFSMLTCSRIANLLTLKWSQIDMDKATFTIPREEMKIKGLSFDRVTPLSKQAINILKSLPRRSDVDWVFYHWQGSTDEHISETSLRNSVRRLNKKRMALKKSPYLDPVEVDNKGNPRIPCPHGLSRTSFDTWASSPKKYKHELFDAEMIEACLDHFNPKYGGAYMREYPLEDMREILQAWADYCFSSRPTL